MHDVKWYLCNETYDSGQRTWPFMMIIVSHIFILLISSRSMIHSRKTARSWKPRILTRTGFDPTFWTRKVWIVTGMVETKSSSGSISNKESESQRETSTSDLYASFFCNFLQKRLDKFKNVSWLCTSKKNTGDGRFLIWNIQRSKLNWPKRFSSRILNTTFISAQIKKNKFW